MSVACWYADWCWIFATRKRWKDPLVLSLLCRPLLYGTIRREILLLYNYIHLCRVCVQGVGLSRSNYPAPLSIVAKGRRTKYYYHGLKSSHIYNMSTKDNGMIVASPSISSRSNGDCILGLTASVDLTCARSTLGLRVSPKISAQFLVFLTCIAWWDDWGIFFLDDWQRTGKYEIIIFVLWMICLSHYLIVSHSILNLLPHDQAHGHEYVN